jgi:drug/metabolite transporter (DMT)-like permease
MNWIVLAILSLGIHSFTTILQKSHSLKRINNTVSTGAIYQIFAGVIIFLYVIFFGNVSAEFTPKSILLSVFSIFIYTLGTGFYFSALHRLNASILTIILTSRAIVTFAVAIIFLSEKADINEYVGMLLIATAVILSQNMKKLNLDLAGFVYAILASIFFGIGNVIERIILHEMDIFLYIVPAFVLPGIFLLAQQQIASGGHKMIINRTIILNFLLIGILVAISAVMSLTALSDAPTTAHYAFVTQTRVIVIAVLAYFLLHEKTHVKRRLFSAFLSVLGLVLLA